MEDGFKMFDFSDLKSIHVELTSVCQASCPMCARNYHGGLPNPNLPIGEITYKDFTSIFTSEVLTQIRYIYFCGNYGDPIMSTHLLDIVKYCRDTNPEIELGIHTNGSARNESWWKELAESLPINHCVHFALDGLEDTHHLYRIGTSFKKIIDNAKTFIKSGGRAEWVFLCFKHNEHQVEEARELAKELGFFRFIHKRTIRFVEKPWFDVLDRSGNVQYKLEAPVEHTMTYIKPEMIKGYKKIVESAKIECKVQEEKSIYIDAFKTLWPCCWIGAIPYIYSYPSELAHTYQSDQISAINQLVEDVGGYRSINLSNRSIKEILEDNKWKNIWSEYWRDKKLATCAKVCGSFPEISIPQHKDQFIDKSQL